MALRDITLPKVKEFLKHFDGNVTRGGNHYLYINLTSDNGIYFLRHFRKTGKRDYSLLGTVHIEYGSYKGVWMLHGWGITSAAWKYLEGLGAIVYNVLN